MSFTPAAVKDKILNMYPEIEKHGIIVNLEFDEAKDSFIVKFKKDKN